MRGFKTLFVFSKFLEIILAKYEEYFAIITSKQFWECIKFVFEKRCTVLSVYQNCISFFYTFYYEKKSSYFVLIF